MDTRNRTGRALGAAILLAATVLWADVRDDVSQARRDLDSPSSRVHNDPRGVIEFQGLGAGGADRQDVRKKRGRLEFRIGGECLESDGSSRVRAAGTAVAVR